MKGERTVVLLLTVAVLAVFGIVAKQHMEEKHADDLPSVPSSVTFAGKTLDVPTDWHVYEAGSRDTSLDLLRHANDTLGPSLTLEDERGKPEIPAKFVSGWMRAQRVPGFQPQSLDEFHDAAVDAAGAPCVKIDWGGSRTPLRFICLSSNGRWKLTLSGTEDDVPALDAMARQLSAFEQGL